MSECGQCKTCGRGFQRCTNKNSFIFLYCSDLYYTKFLCKLMEVKNQSELDKLKAEQKIEETNEINETE